MSFWHLVGLSDWELVCLEIFCLESLKKEKRFSLNILAEVFQALQA